MKNLLTVSLLSIVSTVALAQSLTDTNSNSDGRAQPVQQTAPQQAPADTAQPAKPTQPIEPQSMPKPAANDIGNGADSLKAAAESPVEEPNLHSATKPAAEEPAQNAMMKPHANTDAMRKFAEARLQFLDNLKTCTPIELTIDKSPIPDSEIKLKIVGMKDDKCETESHLVIPQQHASVTSMCAYSQADISVLTDPEVYQRLNNIKNGVSDTKHTSKKENGEADIYKRISQIEQAACQVKQDSDKPNE